MATSWVSLPKTWSNKRKVEKLDPRAYAAVSRAMLRAVAETGSTFSIWSAGRTKADQVAIFKKNYRRVSRGRKLSTDRGYAGSIWARKAGGVSVASPDLGSNHEDGMAVDIHPAAIQNWLKSNGLRFGISWDEGKRVGENWHFRVIPSRDQYTADGVPNVAGIQKVVGATVDNKFGPGTSAKVKAWQKKHGLTADGIPGPATERAMGLGKGDAPVVVSPGTRPKPKPVVAARDYNLEVAGPAKNAYDARTYGGVDYKLKHVTIHWWGKPSGQSYEGIRDYLIDNARQVSAHYVVSGNRVARILPENRGAWGNGNRTANLEGIVIGCDPNKVLETLPTIAALLADIFKRNGELPVYPHSHWTNTQCPGDYLPYLPEIVAMAKGGTVNLGRPVVVSKPKPKGLVEDGRWGTTTTKALQRFLNSRVKARKLAIDGRMGPNAWKSLQEYLGHPVIDGLIENQSYKPDELGNGISDNGWEYTGRNSKGSKTIKRLQRWIGVSQDGVIYEGTTRALQDKLNQHGMG